jgi:hypothetical protein
LSYGHSASGVEIPEESSPSRKRAAAAMAGVEELRGEVQALKTTVEALTQQLAQGRVPSVRAPLPETFKGQADDFRYFMGTVRAYCELTNVPLDKRVDLAVSCLAKGPAKIWASHKAKLVRDKTGDPKDLDIFTTCMSKTYDSGDRAAKARVKIDKIFQGSDTLERYVERFMSLVAEIEAEGELSTSEKLHRFRKGLKTDLQYTALMDTRTGRPFEDLEDLIQFLTRFDAALGGVSSQDKGPQLNAIRSDRPAKRGRPGRGPLQPRVAVTRAHPSSFYFDEAMAYPVGQPFAAAAMGQPQFMPGQRMFYPRMDGLPPERRVDMRQQIPMDRRCYVCGRPGCESWRHSKPGMTYRDALMRPAPPGRMGQDRTHADPEHNFYDRFALGRGQSRRKGPGRFGLGRARPL